MRKPNTLESLDEDDRTPKLCYASTEQAQGSCRINHPGIVPQVCTRLHGRPRQVMFLEDETASLRSLLRVRGLASPLATMQLGCLGRCRLFQASLLPSDSRTHESEPNDPGVDKQGCSGSKPECERKLRLKSRAYGRGTSDTKTRAAKVTPRVKRQESHQGKRETTSTLSSRSFSSLVPWRKEKEVCLPSPSAFTADTTPSHRAVPSFARPCIDAPTHTWTEGGQRAMVLLFFVCESVCTCVHVSMHVRARERCRASAHKHGLVMGTYVN